MNKTGLRVLLTGLIIAGMASVCLRPETSENDEAWKRLKKMRVRAGVMIGKGRPNYTEAYVRMTDVRAMLEAAGIMENVTVLLFADFGTKIFLGTYAPVLVDRGRRWAESDVPVHSQCVPGDPGSQFPGGGSVPVPVPGQLRQSQGHHPHPADGSDRPDFLSASAGRCRAADRCYHFAHF